MYLPDQIQQWHWANSRTWRASLVIGVVLLLSAGIAYLLSPFQTIIVLVLLVATLGAILFFRWPHIAVTALIPVSMISGVTAKIGVGNNVNDPMLFVAFLTGLTILDMAIRHRQIYLVPSRCMLPLLAMIITAVLAFGVGQLPWFLFAKPAPLAAQLGGLGLFILSAAAFWLVAHHLADLTWLRYMTWLFLLLGAVYILGRLIPALGILSLLQRGAHGGLFWVWVTALALSQALFNRDLKLIARAALAGLVVITFGLTWFHTRDWASGWAPMLISIVVLLWLRSWRLGMFLGLVGLTLKLAIDPGLITGLIEGDWYSIFTRWAAWEIVLGEILRVSPLFGLGPANYYHYTSLFPILGWHVAFNSHNQYIDLAAQTGILGLGCFFWFVWEVGRLSLRLRERAPDDFARAYLYGAFAGLIGTLAAGMVADWLIPFVYNIGFMGFRSSIFAWLFLGGVVALERITQTSEKAVR